VPSVSETRRIEPRILTVLARETCFSVRRQSYQGNLVYLHGT